MTLDEIRQELASCNNCGLHRGRKNLVFGVGSPTAKIMIIGEGPGANEDEKGEPFVGAAGHLLNRLLEKVELRREETYIANVVKCRPPMNRDPSVEEASACLPFLRQQMGAIRPRVVVTLGKYAAWYTTHVFGSMGDILGMPDLYCGFITPSVPVVPLYHPAYLLRLGEGDRAKVAFTDTLNRLRRAKSIADSSP